MYSWEIEQLLKLKNYLISCEDYLHILNTSPQIREVKYDGYNQNFNLKTDDNYDFNFKVYVLKK